jgi:peroxiredoxin
MFLALSLSSAAVHAGEGLKPGDAAPPFELAGSDGSAHSLEGHRGKTVVIAWFPKAFTGG